MKSVICGVVLAALISPALADEYWVEYNYSTQKCSIVEKKSQESAAGSAPAIIAAHATNIMAPKDPATSDATHGTNVANPTTDGAVSDRANASSSSAAATKTSTQDNNIDPAPVLIALAEQKDAAEAAARRVAAKTAMRSPEQSVTEMAANTVLGTTMRSPEPAVTEMQVIMAMWAIWARKKAASEAASSDAGKELIGSVSQSREQAERKMNIMRRCGLAP